MRKQKKIVSNIIILLLLVMSLQALAENASSSISVPITITIDPVVEVRMVKEDLKLDAANGSEAVATTRFSVGTNDWPLELHFTLLSPCLEPALSFECRLEAEKGGPITSSWTQIGATSLSRSVSLPFAGWTDYTMSVRATTKENAVSGDFHQTLRMIFHSMSGLVVVRDIQVFGTVLPGVPADSVKADGQGGSSGFEVARDALPSGHTDKIPSLPAQKKVLVITWEGIQVIHGKELPAT